MKDDQIDGKWSPDNFYALADSYPELAFQISISSGAYFEWLIRWIGEHDLSDFIEATTEEPLISQLNQKFDEERSLRGEWGSHASYWGSVHDNYEFARYVADLKPSEQRLTETELLNSYDQNYNSQKRRLFDKDYLLLLQDLQKLLPKYTKDAELIINYVQNLDLTQISKLKNSYPNLIKHLENRTDYTSNILYELAYSIGMVVFVGVLYRHGLWKQYDKPLVRWLGRISRLFPDFFRHDLVLIELYLLDGGH